MMEWQDHGILLTSRTHGESGAIISVLTAEHGRYAGIVRGGASRRMKPILQPGAGLALRWRARLEEHLGTFAVEPTISRADLLADRETLAGLNAVTTMAQLFLPEREPHPNHFAATVALLEAMRTDPAWPARYILWEIDLLAAVGYRLSLQSCAVTGAETGLAFVSPRTGAAVTAEAGAEWADRLLPLPPFLRPEPSEVEIKAAHIREGFALTGHFLQSWLCPALGVAQMPPARERLARALSR
ncbi:MAG: DNA repair protein RecO [Pseudomonadota bacterium]